MAASSPTLKLSAPAKVNIALHVVGRNADGYHKLDSLVVFASVKDQLEFTLAEGLSLTVDGPCARGVPDDGRNLVLKAAAALREYAGSPHLGAQIHLNKHIPHAAGLGGGSADAAATLIVLNTLWGLDLETPTLENIGLELGADIPACLHSTTLRMQGVGEQITPLSLNLKGRPALLLVNPGMAVPTKAVFSSFGDRFGGALRPIPKTGWTDVAALVKYLRASRNDLEGPAGKLAPIVMKVVKLLKARPECHLARMSGSGATCYGLFSEERWAWKAMHTLKESHPDWWFAHVPIGREGEAIVVDAR